MRGAGKDSEAHVENAKIEACGEGLHEMTRLSRWLLDDAGLLGKIALVATVGCILGAILTREWASAAIGCASFAAGHVLGRVLRRVL